MRSITFSILLLFSTQAFGMLRLLPQAGAKLASRTLRSNRFSRKPLEVFASRSIFGTTGSTWTTYDGKKVEDVGETVPFRFALVREQKKTNILLQIISIKVEKLATINNREACNELNEAIKPLQKELDQLN